MVFFIVVEYFEIEKEEGFWRKDFDRCLDDVWLDVEEEKELGEWNVCVIDLFIDFGVEKEVIELVFGVIKRFIFLMKEGGEDFEGGE